MKKVSKLNQAIYEKMMRFYEQEKYDQAIELGKTLLDKARMLSDIEGEKRALEVLSYASYYKVDYLGAMRYIGRFSKMIEEDGTLLEKVKTYNVFFSLFTRLSDYKEALKWLKKVEIIVHEENLGIEIVKNYNNYGFFYNTFQEYKDAIPYLEKALVLAREMDFLAIVPVIYGNLAISYLRTHNLEKTQEALDYVFNTAREDYSLSMAEAYMIMGELKGLQGDYDKAIASIETSKKLCEEEGYQQELAEALKIESEIYKKMGQYEKALNNLEQYLALSNQLQKHAREGALMKLQMEYDVNRQQMETKILREQNALLEEKNRKIEEQSRELTRLNDVLGRQNDDLHQSAIEDYLTGVYNRKYFTLKLQEEFSIAKENDKDMACIIFDIDHFKQINDRFGHLVGDEVIQHVSSLCEQCLDTDALIGRFGGDEFMILLPNSDVDDAKMLAETLIRTVREEPLIMDKKAIEVTLSIGITDNHYLSPRNTDEMLTIADQGLYQAKEAGRNRCCQYRE